MWIQRAVVVALSLIATCDEVQLVSLATAEEQRSRRPQRVESAERVLKRFLVAMISADREALEATTTENENLDLLLLDQRPPAIAISAFKSRVQSSRIKSHKAGEEVKLPNGKTFTVTPDLISVDRKVLSLVAMPIPMCVVRTDGHWKVDASPIIAARQAAAKSKANNAASTD